MSDLERAYRRALRRYPKGWRRNHGEALLGVLLDTAEAEGRVHMSPEERRNLLINGTRLRFARAVPVVLFVIATLLLVHTLALVLGGVGLDATLILAAPQIPAPPIGGSSIRPSIDQPAWVVYAVSVVLLLAAGLGGLLIVRRNRRVDRAER